MVLVVELERCSPDRFSGTIASYGLNLKMKLVECLSQRQSSFGLAMTYGFNLSWVLYVIVWHLCNLENDMISVEIMLQYSKLPSEPPLVIETNRPSHSWPLHGEIIIRDLQVCISM